MVMRLAAVLVLLALSPLARAQTPTEPDAATRERARALFAEGVTALDAGDCPGSLAKFREAYGLLAEPAILYNLATAESECHDLAEAAAHYRAFLASPPNPRTTRFRAEARRQLRAIEARLAHVSVTLAGPLEGVSIRIDARTIEQGAFSDVAVAPGDRVLVAVRDGAEVARLAFTVRDAERRTLELTIPPAVTAPTATATAQAASDREGSRRSVLGPVPSRRKRRIVIGVTSGVVAVFATGAIVAATR